MGDVIFMNLSKTLLNYEELMAQVEQAISEGKAFIGSNDINFGDDGICFYHHGIEGLSLYTEEEYLNNKYEHYQDEIDEWDEELEGEPFPYESFEEWLDDDTDDFYVSLEYIQQELYELIQDAVNEYC